MSVGTRSRTRSSHVWIVIIAVIGVPTKSAFLHSRIGYPYSGYHAHVDSHRPRIETGRRHLRPQPKRRTPQTPAIGLAAPHGADGGVVVGARWPGRVGAPLPIGRCRSFRRSSARRRPKSPIGATSTTCPSRCASSAIRRCLPPMARLRLVRGARRDAMPARTSGGCPARRRRPRLRRRCSSERSGRSRCGRGRKTTAAARLHRKRIQFASAEAIEKVGVDIAIVGEQPIVEAIVANGEIVYDETRMAHLVEPRGRARCGAWRSRSAIASRRATCWR